MKNEKKKLREAFDTVPHTSKEETLRRLGVSPKQEKAVFRPRHWAVAAVCLAIVCSLSTALALAASGGELFEKLKEIILPEEESANTSSLPEESEPPYFEGHVILSSTGWKEDAGNLVTGEFAGLDEAFAAVRKGLPTEAPLYYPAWDGDGKGAYGTGSLLLLLNARGIVDPATMEERYYPCLQINYQTRQVVSLQIHIGRRLGTPESYTERYETEAGVFYLREWAHPVTGEVTFFATGDLEGCGYEIQAHSAEAAKKMADSLKKPTE